MKLFGLKLLLLPIHQILFHYDVVNIYGTFWLWSYFDFPFTKYCFVMMHSIWNFVALKLLWLSILQILFRYDVVNMEMFGTEVTLTFHPPNIDALGCSHYRALSFRGGFDLQSTKYCFIRWQIIICHLMGGGGGGGVFRSTVVSRWIAVQQMKRSILHQGHDS